MSLRDVPLSYYGGLTTVPESVQNNFLAEFAANGATHIGIGVAWCQQMLAEPAFADKLVKRLADFGLQPGGMHAPWGPGHDITITDMQRRPYMIAEHLALLAIAGNLGLKTYTVHPHAGFDPTRRNDEQLHRLAVETLEQLLPQAEKSQVVIAIENNFTPPTTSDRLLAMIEPFASPWLGFCYDTGHAHILESAPGKAFTDIAPISHWQLYPKEFHDGQLEQMAPHLVTCHLHDNAGLTDSHLLPGKGTIDWPRVMGIISRCPRLLEMHCEVNIIPKCIPIRTACEVFSPAFLAGEK
ncbi:MAG: sugar phosphate isomerase/epimerase [Lentisphaerae bacterium]|nr:sugar phosphate isomerase/epimerase [Lentisphaerota bacterium]